MTNLPCDYWEKLTSSAGRRTVRGNRFLSIVQTISRYLRDVQEVVCVLRLLHVGSGQFLVERLTSGGAGGVELLLKRFPGRLFHRRAHLPISCSSDSENNCRMYCRYVEQRTNNRLTLLRGHLTRLPMPVGLDIFYPVGML